MSTIVIEQAKVELDVNQLIRAILTLGADERQLVGKALDQDWAKELDDILARVHARFLAEPISDAEIAAEVEAARTEHYAATHRR